MNEATRIKFLTTLAAQGVRVVAVSKTKPNEDILKLYDEGYRDFGENRVQELVDKQSQLPNDIRWHMIGVLQKNKVKYIAPFVHLIHSVSTAKLVRVINKEAAKNDRNIPILLQVKIADEDTKSGLEHTEVKAILKDTIDEVYPHIQIHGFMGMATFTDDHDQVRKEFIGLKTFATEMLELFPSAFDLGDQVELVLSMGMSGDYKVAIEEGANMVRIGSLLFGPR